MLLPQRKIDAPTLVATACCAIAALMSFQAVAHPVYMDHIEHQVHLSVSPDNIDVIIELRFNELRSLSERRSMDTDRNGLVTLAERERYLRRIRREVGDAFRLSCRARTLDLIELYEPRIDLLGDEGVSPAHHRLRLYYFARTPKDFTGPMKLDFEDRSWPSAPSLWFFRTEAHDGVSLKVEPVAASRPAGEAGTCLRGQVTVYSPGGRTQATRPAEPGR